MALSKIIYYFEFHSLRSFMEVYYILNQSLFNFQQYTNIPILEKFSHAHAHKKTTKNVAVNVQYADED